MSDYSPSPLAWTAKTPLQQIKEPTISKIELSSKDMDKLQICLQSNKMSPMSKDMRQRKIVGICQCGGTPEYIISYHYEGLTKIERYCESCLSKAKENINQK